MLPQSAARCALALTTALLAPAFAASTPFQKNRKTPSVAELVQKIEASRKLAVLQRYGVTMQLTRLRTDEARRASLALLETETAPAIRSRFLTHAATLPGLEDLMKRELQASTFATSKRTAAQYLLDKTEGGWRTLTGLYDRADSKTGIATRQAILIALASSREAPAQKAFSKRCRRLSDRDLSRVLLGLRGKSGPHVDGIRRKALESSYPVLLGAALQQLCALGDEKAIAMARELADDKKRAAALDYQVAMALFEKPASEDLARLARILGSSRKRISNAVVDRQLKRLVKQDFVKTWAIRQGSEAREGALQSFAVRLLERLDGADVRDALLELTQTKSPALRRRAIFVLAKKGDRRVVEVLERAFSEGGTDDKIDALEALALVRSKDAEFHERLLHLSSSGDVGLRLVALDIGAKLGLRTLLKQLPALLKSKDWRLRAGGIQLARELRAKENIAPLIALLAKEDGRLAEDARTALASLTRLYYHRARDWKRWWKREGKSFVLPPPEAKKKASTAAGRQRQAGGNTSATFYGIPVLSDRVVYCVDVSGSMSAKMGTGITRLKVAQEALIKALESSSKQSLVNVIFFESGVHPYERKTISLKRKKNRAELAKFTRRQTPRGGTNIHGALVEAMKDTQVDTIFLLSDGAPSAGEITDPVRLVEDIARRNRRRRIVFHCISIGSDSAMLRRLAEATGGRYSRQ